MFYTNIFIEESQARKPEKCLVKLKICHSKWCRKICNQTFSCGLIMEATLDEKIEHLCVCVLFFFYISSNKCCRKWYNFYLKCNLRANFKKWCQTGNMVLFIECGNSLSVTHGFMFTYTVCTWENKHSAFCFEHFFVSCPVILTWIHKVLYT